MNQLTVATHNQKQELWIERIRACGSSGMTATDWCVANNIGNISYYYWMRKIKQEAFDNLPVERKCRVSLNPLTSAFAEVPIPKPTPSENIWVHLAQVVGGFVLLYKLLENGRFQWPKDQEEVRHISHKEFRLLLEVLTIDFYY